MILPRGPCILRTRSKTSILLSPTRIRTRYMATVRSSLPHEERTAAEPRENVLEPVILSHIRQINDNIRLFRLNPVDPNHTIKFLPGQWLDTYLPGLPKAGGFTLTSTPHEARPSKDALPYLELAVQKSTNPPAQWLWRREEDVIGAQLTVRVGGSFTWPPQDLKISDVDRLVLVAGGVGINPLISIFSHLIRSQQRPREIHFIYATKASPELDAQRILFLPRLTDLIAASADPKVTLSLFLTETGEDGRIEHGKFPNRTFARRVTNADILQAVDGYQEGRQTDRSNTLCYVCGPPAMTDGFVEFVSKQPGMSQDRVLCEKWW